MTDERKLRDLVFHHHAQADHYFELSDAARDSDKAGSLGLYSLALDHEARAAELEALL